MAEGFGVQGTARKWKDTTKDNPFEAQAFDSSDAVYQLYLLPTLPLPSTVSILRTYNLFSLVI
jgi:N-acyl-L-homoserine lactone synthetase